MAYERNETIEELEETIRIKKDKLERSEAHSNKRSTKTKPLKESQLKAGIYSAEQRLQAALAERGEQEVVEEQAQETAESEPVQPEEEVVENVGAEQEELIEITQEETVEMAPEEVVENIQEEVVETGSEPNVRDFIEQELAEYRKSLNPGVPSWHPKDRDKSVQAIGQFLNEEYNGLENKRTRSGRPVLSLEEEREVFRAKEGTGSFGVGYIKNGDVGSSAKESVEKAEKSEDLRYREQRVGAEIDDRIKGIYGDFLSRDEVFKPDRIKRATEIYCRIEVLHEHHQEVKQKQEDLILHEEILGPYKKSKKETTQVRKPGIAGIFGAKEDVIRNVPLTNEEMFEKKREAQNTLNGLLENNGISQQGYDKVSESLDRLYGNEPERISDMDLQDAKEEAGITEPEPVIYESTNEAGNEMSDDQDMGYGYDDQPVLSQPGLDELD